MPIQEKKKKNKKPNKQNPITTNIEPAKKQKIIFIKLVKGLVFFICFCLYSNSVLNLRFLKQRREQFAQCLHAQSHSKKNNRFIT